MIINQITIVLCLTAGTALIMWIGEHITENGVGNGISLIIFISIISRLPSALINLVNVCIDAEHEHDLGFGGGGFGGGIADHYRYHVYRSR